MLLLCYEPFANVNYTLYLHIIRYTSRAIRLLAFYVWLFVVTFTFYVMITVKCVTNFGHVLGFSNNNISDYDPD